MQIKIPIQSTKYKHAWPPFFADDTLKCISLNEIYLFRIKLQWNIFHMVQIDNTQTLVQVMAYDEKATSH